MLIFFNWIAMIPLIIGVAIGMVLEKAIPDLNPGIGLLIMALCMLGSDVWFRFLRNPEERSLFHPRKGGHIMFLPAWLWGTAGCVLSVLVLVKGGLT